MDFNNLFLKYTTLKVVKLIKYNVQSGIYVYLLNFWYIPCLISTELISGIYIILI